MVREMIKRAFFLSSAGTTCQGSLPAAGLAQAGFIGLHIVVPEFPLFEVAPAEFPVLIRLVDAGKKAAALLVLGNVEEKFNDARSVAVKMVFQIHDGTIPVPPVVFSSSSSFGSPSLWRISGWTRTINTSS